MFDSPQGWVLISGKQNKVLWGLLERCSIIYCAIVMSMMTVIMIANQFKCLQIQTRITVNEKSLHKYHKPDILYWMWRDSGCKSETAQNILRKINVVSFSEKDIKCYQGLLILQKNDVIYQLLCRDVQKLFSSWFLFLGLKNLQVIKLLDWSWNVWVCFSFSRCNFSVMHIRLEM